MDVEPAQAAATMTAASAYPYASPGAPPYMGGGRGGYNPGYPGYPGVPAQTPRMPAPPPANGKPVKFLTENKLRITLLVEVVKPKPGR